MARLRALSGRDVLAILSRFGFQPASQRGSHLKLRRLLRDGERQTLTIAMHDEIDKGTLRAIYSQALRYITDSDLRPFFYTE